MSFLDQLLQQSGARLGTASGALADLPSRTKARLLAICGARFRDGSPLTAAGFFELSEEIGDSLEAHEAVIAGHEERVMQLVEELRLARERIDQLERTVAALDWRPGR